MVIRLSFVFLIFVSLVSSFFAEDIHLFIKTNGIYYASAPKSGVLDTGIVVDKNLIDSLTNKHYKSIIEGNSVPVNRIPITTLD